VHLIRDEAAGLEGVIVLAMREDGDRLADAEYLGWSPRTPG